MTVKQPSQSSSLDDWLCYLEAIHPATIEMGLERVAQVAEQAGLLEPFSKIILIGGTNGKGTTARCLESLLLAQGFSVGTYASPHLVRYNERVRVNGAELEDQYHIDAFKFLDDTRKNTQLTYFEFGTLGALSIFKRCKVDYILLEVGLGGRFDATNIVSPFASVITTVDLDHKEYLGDTRELVGYDKAGIFRSGKPAIVGDLNIPHTVTDYGDEIAADMVLSKRDFYFTPLDSQFRWQYLDFDWHFDKPAIPAQNAATALTVLAKLELLPSYDAVKTCLANLQVEGRFQRLNTTPLVYTDVAHNPESARYLATKLQELKQKGFKIHALVAMLADKDKASVLKEVTQYVDSWSLASLSGPRGERAENLKPLLDPSCNVTVFDSVTAALDTQLDTLTSDQALVVFGSFFTVAEAMEYWRK
ncbi:bifunctional tetrahydrofolate synthase/dihydrofolate synthase [Pseudoalteromonas sp. M8]|uniref:bifunctional tetrahydrofolate synthase/dihydrofolate synthase n=1 Tax=Pseudoalteromonas sp. M8 TaxID=2692624 RepID=UPI001BACC04B|nr:bifunctional tetrahydrofolate synthase/dihydrofolate synthase [Pseudoalteromonas sp. M8]QUI70337.1 bifunctional tetrahydrofolate synthase/dihydrofolate synthase [Pseudoalteromonas sp. M8]